jgi:hypothetical protein
MKSLAMLGVPTSPVLLGHEAHEIHDAVRVAPFVGDRLLVTVAEDALQVALAGRLHQAVDLLD